MGNKTILAGVLGTGLIVSTITWTGGANIDSIRSSVNNIQNKLTTAIADNNFLKTSYDTLKTTFDGAVQQANTTINDMKREREILNGQIEDLTKQLNDLKAQGQTGQAEAQAEIDRLEAELEKANAQIQALDEEIKALDSGTTYTAVNKTSYTAPTTANIDDGTGVFITAEATAFNKAGAEIMAQESYRKAIEADHLAKGMEFTIIGVDVYTEGTQTYLSYVIKPKVSEVEAIYSQAVNDLLMAIGKGSISILYYENIDGQKAGLSMLQ